MISLKLPKTPLLPFLKWPGSKRRLIPELVARMPTSYRTYYEPFCGSAASFFHLRPTFACLSDTNQDLISTYRHIQNDVESVIGQLQEHAYQHSVRGGHYETTRNLWNDRDYGSKAWRAATFCYLNKTCFNGLWRVNSKGEFNVPKGDYKNPKICDPDLLRAASKALAVTALAVEDYQTAVKNAKKDDFVYLDPPYLPTSKTSNFTDYTKDGFGEENHRNLAELAKDLVKRGCFVMASNSDTPLARELYKEFDIHEVTRSGSMNSDPTKRSRVGELIITGGYEIDWVKAARKLTQVSKPRC